MKANELEEFSAKELDRLSREREDAIKAKGGLPYLGSLPVGESKLILQAKIPTDNPDRDGRPRKGRKTEKTVRQGFNLPDNDPRKRRDAFSNRPENSLSSRRLRTAKISPGP